MVKGIIFDLDGVLVFTDRYHYQAWKMLADRLGIYFDEEINKRLRGVDRMESLEIILEKSGGVSYTEAEKEEFAKEKNEKYRKLLLGLTPEDISASVRDTLGKLREKGYLLAVGSSSKNAGLILEKTNLRGAFDAVSDGTCITRSKPDPEVFVKAAQMLGLAGEECAVVEDAKAGIEAAKAAGMMAIGIGDAAAYSLTDRAIDRFDELLTIFR